MTRFADRVLATRLERLVVAECRRFAETTAELFPEVGPAWFETAGGIVVFLGEESPVNGAWGLGLDGEVDAETLADVEHFFAERGATPVASVWPFADASLMRALGERGWAPRAFENVLVRDLLGGEGLPEPDAHVEIRVASTVEEHELWARSVALGFSAPEPPSPAEERLSRAAAADATASLLLAYVDAELAGTAQLSVEDGVGWLSADTTLPRFRGRGVQRSLQRARLALARDAGCDVAVSESMPGSASQRNMERLGFALAYVRVECGRV